MKDKKKFQSQEEFNAALAKMNKDFYEYVNARAGEELFVLVDPEVHQECVDIIEEGEAAVKNTMCFNDLKDRVDQLEASNCALVTLLAIKFHDFADYYNTYHKTALDNIKKKDEE